MMWQVIVKSDPAGSIRGYDLVEETAEYIVATKVQEYRDRIPWHNILEVREPLNA